MDMGFQRDVALGRRRFLKGVGACVALPLLESLMPRSLVAKTAAQGLAQTATGAPLRLGFVYFPNGAIPAKWWPTGDERRFELNDTMKPLERFRDRIQILGGLDHANANPGDDGGGDHARANGVFLTGVRINKSPTDIRAGISIDQEVARRVGSLTRYPSLELTCDRSRPSGLCDSGYSCAYQYNVSWKSATVPMAPESNPRKAFERLFGEGPHGERSFNAKQRMMNRRSVLDCLLGDVADLQPRLGVRDREKLDQYLTGLREVEQRIEKMERHGMAPDPDVESPSGIPSAHSSHIDMMYDVLALAFQTDSTRVATMMMAHDGDNRSHEEIGINEGHHNLSHHLLDKEKIEKVARIDRWYVERYASFLEKLDSIQDVDGNSLLHNTMIVYGSGNADGNHHSHDNLPIVLSGGQGAGVEGNRYANYGAQPTTNLFLSLADKLGVDDLPRFGDSTGRLRGI
ncbi:DUF1552 domain-containing protein [Pelagicoccus sp. SDUM812005]|nr:DUF1552 domain-containing protein [Pelagicoccus sp. SDUM812005]